MKKRMLVPALVTSIVLASGFGVALACDKADHAADAKAVADAKPACCVQAADAKPAGCCADVAAKPACCGGAEAAVAVAGQPAPVAVPAVAVTAAAAPCAAKAADANAAPCAKKASQVIAKNEPAPPAR